MFYIAADRGGPPFFFGNETKTAGSGMKHTGQTACYTAKETECAAFVGQGGNLPWMFKEINGVKMKRFLKIDSLYLIQYT
jgi:hypothetical protein